MYRRTEFRLFVVIKIIANIFALTALAFVLGYHFYKPNDLYRDFACIALGVSLLLHIQVLMQKVEVHEKRISHFAHLQVPGKRAEGAGSNLALTLYFLLFWIAAVLAVVAFISEKSEMREFIENQKIEMGLS